MHDQPARRTLCVDDLHRAGGRAHAAGIPDLAATLRVEWGTIQDHLDLRARVRLADRFPVDKQHHEPGPRRMLRVPHKLGADAFLDKLGIPAVVARSAERLRSPRSLALRLHRAGEALFINSQPMVPCDVACHLHREPECIVQPEHLLAGEHAP